MKSLQILIIILILFPGCQWDVKVEADRQDRHEDEKQIHNLEWLIGSWVTVTDNGNLYEVWHMESDTLFRGVSFLVSGSDTLFSETITLHQSGDQLFYIPAVSDQNMGRPIHFTLVEANGEFVFENREHDFPQRIIYSHPHPDSLIARVEGDDNGTFREVEFRLKRKTD